MIERSLPQLELALLHPDGTHNGVLRLSCRPSQTHWHELDALVDRREESDLDGASGVQLLEDIEYRYEVLGVSGEIQLEPREVFDADGASKLTGRMRPGRRTGTIVVAVSNMGGSLVGRCEVEVRSRKLSYLDEYRWMLGRIADEATEALMQRFAASEIRLTPKQAGSPQTIYQRFALLKALLEADALDSAISLITHRPHLEYRTEVERTHPARGMRPGRQTVKALTGPGPRMPAEMAGLATVPREIDRTIHVESLDTIPNRFVKHALERWLGLVIDVRTALGEAASAADMRGVREADALEHWITAHLNTPKFRDVGILTSFPASNQVLQRREGYRDIFRAYLMMEVAADLDWPGGDDIFRAGQRDVATLYEYWVFLELARIVSTVIGRPLDTSSLFSIEDGGLSLNLRRRNSKAVVEGWVERRGRRLDLKLYFNRQFNRGRNGSWTTPVRPDCSLHVSVHGHPSTATWLHFDAKYRLHELTEVLMEPISGEEDEEPTTVRTATAKSDDLLKMHSYRDAVRRTTGAYVLYPGTDDKPEKQMLKYHEVLPGLGAFVLRPTPDGHGAEAGADALSRFIDDVLGHVAAQGTSRERARYWEGESYQAWEANSGALERRLNPVDFLAMPPDDTLVLLGYVKSDAHRQWIADNGLYNIRADGGRDGAIGLDSAELRASLLLLYNPQWKATELYRLNGAIYLRTAQELAATGYLAPGGDRYLCLGLEPIEAEGMSAHEVAKLARHGRQPEQWEAPLVRSWADLQVALLEGE